MSKWERNLSRTVGCCRRGFGSWVEACVPVRRENRMHDFGEAELSQGLEQWLLPVVPQNRKMKRGGIVVSVEITHRRERVLKNTQWVEMGNRLADPELVVRDTRHYLVTDRRWCVVATRGIQIPGDGQRIVIRLHVREQGLHLAAAAFRRTFIFQVGGDDCG